MVTKKEFQRRLREKIEIRDGLFNSPSSDHYHNTNWHNKYLQKAKTEFDNCLSLCKKGE